MLVHTSCSHPSTTVDRFGDEVCRWCWGLVRAQVSQHREGLWGCWHDKRDHCSELGPPPGR